jgi:pimeloyl-ACP methyl ester carboxylesterase
MPLAGVAATATAIMTAVRMSSGAADPPEQRIGCHSIDVGIDHGVERRPGEDPETGGDAEADGVGHAASRRCLATTARRVLDVDLERGVMGTIPWAATGTGPPLVFLAGLSPVTGVAGDRFAQSILAPVRPLTGTRRVFVLNRRSHLPERLTMTALAAEHADALRSYFPDPVDLIGLSTGGSIAQQLAAEHPDTIRRLVLVSTACRLGPVGRSMQAAIAVELRTGQIRRAAAIAVAGLFPRAGLIARGVGRVAGPRLIPNATAAADLAATLEAEDGFDLANCRSAIQAPTLIIAGGRDRYYSPALFDETAELIPNSRLSMYPNKGHLAVTWHRNARAQIDGFLNWETPRAIKLASR